MTTVNLVRAKIFANRGVDFFDRHRLDNLRVAVYVINAKLVELRVPHRLRQPSVGRQTTLNEPMAEDFSSPSSSARIRSDIIAQNAESELIAFSCCWIDGDATTRGLRLRKARGEARVDAVGQAS